MSSAPKDVTLNESLRALEQQTALASRNAEAIKRQLQRVEAALYATTVRSILDDIVVTGQFGTDHEIHLAYTKCQGHWRLGFSVSGRGKPPPGEWLPLTEAPISVRIAAVELLPELINEVGIRQTQQAVEAENALSRLIGPSSGKEGT